MEILFKWCVTGCCVGLRTNKANARQGTFVRLDLNENLAVSDLAGENLGAFTFTAARAIFETDMPAVPAANNLSCLDDAFTQWKSEVGAEVFNRVNGVVPAKQCDIEACCLYGVT